MKAIDILLMGVSKFDQGLYTESELDTMIGSQNYIPIATYNELVAFRNSISQTMGFGTKFQATYLTGWDKKYVLVRNIDVQNNGWESTASSSITFDGNLLTISNIDIQGANDVNSFLGIGSGTSQMNLKNIIIDGLTGTGGLIGYDTNVNSIIENCVLINADITSAKNYVGGICEIFHGTISKCAYIGDVSNSSSGTWTASICSYNYGTISQCYCVGNVTGEGVGGLVAINAGTISNCWSGSNTSNTVGYSASLVAYNNGTVTNCYSFGIATGGTVGGLCASNSATITNSYWDTVASGNQTSSGGTGKTTTEMKEGLIPDTTIYVSWDDTVWDAGTTSDYPFLINNN